MWGEKKAKKQKVDEHVEVEENNDQEEAGLKQHMEIVKDDEVAIDSISLARKPPMIVEYKIVKKGIMGHYQLIRADGSSKSYSSIIGILTARVKLVLLVKVLTTACAQLQLLKRLTTAVKDIDKKRSMALSEKR
ncbi:hypothetical protein Tco_0688713 [Tanacetum coccineum]